MFSTLSVLSRSLLRIAAVMVFLAGAVEAQITPCPDPVPQTAGTHLFRRPNDRFSIPIKIGDCQTVGIDLRWSNGRDNGSNFVVTFLDEYQQPIYTQLIYGFMTGNRDFPFMGNDSQPWFGNGAMLATPTSLTIQAVEPYANPCAISYRIIRAAPRNPQPKKVEAVAESSVKELRSSPGKLIAEAPSSSSIIYTLETVALPNPRELEFRGKTETIDKAFRLTLKGPGVSNAALIWIDDAALQGSWSYERREMSTLIFDSSVLKDGAEISISNPEGGQLTVLPDRLRLPSSFRTAPATDEAGNSIVGIHRVTMSIGPKRQPLVQIELKTNRPFPPRENPLQMQVGKRFFINELSGDHTGKNLTLTLTPEMFADLKDGAEVVAFFNRPDRSGFAGADVWNFGRLNKGLLAP
jgi:hypothetical protein